MKQINVCISGNIVAFAVAKLNTELGEDVVESYDSLIGLEEDGYIESNYELAFIKELGDIWYDDEDYNVREITKEKGKYLKTKEFWKEKKIEGPFVFEVLDEGEYEYNYIISLEDDEEFEPKKLQLVKSDYEVGFLPYGIIVDYIMYDGKKIECIGEYDYDCGYENGCYWYSDAKQWDSRKGGMIRW